MNVPSTTVSIDRARKIKEIRLGEDRYRWEIESWSRTGPVIRDTYGTTRRSLFIFDVREGKIYIIFNGFYIVHDMKEFIYSLPSGNISFEVSDARQDPTTNIHEISPKKWHKLYQLVGSSEIGICALDRFFHYMNPA